jgi:hypothetical protein
MSSWGPSAHADPAVECADRAEKAADLKQQGKLVEAAPLFEQCAQDSCPRVVRQDCRTALSELQQSAPHLTIHVRDETGADVFDAAVSVDGVAVATDDYARGMLLDPGRHSVRAERGSFFPGEQAILVTAGDRNPSVNLTLRRVHATETDTVRTKNRTPALVVGAGGLAFLAAFGVLGTWTLVDYENLNKTCGGHCMAAQVDPVRVRGAIADVSLGAGVVSLAVATVLWFAAPTTEKARAPQTVVLAW